MERSAPTTGLRCDWQMELGVDMNTSDEVQRNDIRMQIRTQVITHCHEAFVAWQTLNMWHISWLKLSIRSWISGVNVLLPGIAWSQRPQTKNKDAPSSSCTGSLGYKIRLCLLFSAHHPMLVIFRLKYYASVKASENLKRHCWGNCQLAKGADGFPDFSSVTFALTQLFR